MMSTVFTPKHYKLSRLLKRALLTLAIFSWVLATILLFTPVFPHLLYRLSPQTPKLLAQTIGETVKTPPPTTQKKAIPLPPLDTSLPKQNYLYIPSIGVNGLIHEGTWEDSLPLGIWREGRFGTPDSTLPLVLAAHRWGYLNWTNSFRRLNSFYSLPKLKVGDTLDVIWQQRKYTYQVYAEATGATITDYTADLILYTCQLWDNPIRIFKYAKRTN